MNQSNNSNAGGSQMPPIPPLTPVSPQEPQKNRKGAVIAAVIACLLILGGGVAAFFLLRNSDNSSSSNDSSTVVSDSTTANHNNTNCDLEDDVTGKGDADIDLDDDIQINDDTDLSNYPKNEEGDLNEVKQRLSRFQYSSYHNDRFNFDLNYPDFMASDYSQNGDGVKFHYKDITLMTYASHNVLNTDVVTELNRRDTNAIRNYLSSNSFTISGKTDNGLLYEEKAVLKNDVWYTTRLEYPVKYKSIIGSLSQIVTNFEP